EGMLEPGMRRPGIHEVREPELPYIPQPLNDARVEQSFSGGIDPDVVPERIPDERHPFGPAATMFPETDEPNFAMFSRNMPASFFACASYAAPSFHVDRASSTFDGTPSTAVGTARPNTGSVFVGASFSLPLSRARTMARVWESFMRDPTPYAPPLHPVFTSHTCVSLCFVSSSPSSSAYFVGCHTRNTAPKHALNVAWG